MLLRLKIVGSNYVLALPLPLLMLPDNDNEDDGDDDDAVHNTGKDENADDNEA